MYNFITFVHILTCFVLIITILLFQTSKGSALSMFGGGGDSLFSVSTGTTFIKKFTVSVAVVFAITSLLLTLFHSSQTMRSVIQEYPLQPQPRQTAPAQSGQSVPAPTDVGGKPAPAPTGSGGQSAQ